MSKAAQNIQMSATNPGANPNMYTVSDTFNTSDYLNSTSMNVNNTQNLDAFKQASFNTIAQPSTIASPITES